MAVTGSTNKYDCEGYYDDCGNFPDDYDGLFDLFDGYYGNELDY